MNSLKHLSKGTVSTLAVVSFSLIICAMVSPVFLTGWLTLILVATVPTQMVISLVWRCEQPAWICGFAQPYRGLLFTLLTLIVGSVVALFVWAFIGGAMSPPAPFGIMYLILTVPVTLWLIVIFQTWPFSKLSANPLVTGGLVLVAAYAISYLIYRTLFDFGFLAGAPVYDFSLDPGGALMAWYPLVAAVATVDFILIAILFDFWPLGLLAARFPWLGFQPWFGILAGVLVALGTAGLWWVGVLLLKMDIVLFQALVCVPFIFGLFIVLVMFDGVPTLQARQPWRGVQLTLLAGLLSFICLTIYRGIAEKSFQLALGSGTYELELWISSAMLAVTFPAMVLCANYFEFWPLSSRKTQQEASV